MAEQSSNPLVNPPALRGGGSGPQINIGSGGPQKPIRPEFSSPSPLPSVLSGVSPSSCPGNPIGTGSVGAPGKPFR